MVAFSPSGMFRVFLHVAMWVCTHALNTRARSDGLGRAGKVCALLASGFN